MKNNKKSVVIIGKGSSVLKCKKDFIENFDEIAICNFPPMRGYEKNIGNKADYHFYNAHDPNPYDKELINNLGLRSIFNTHEVPHPGDEYCFPDHEFTYHSDYGKNTVKYFLENKNFHPSTGLQAFYYFVKNEEYDKIGLVGFDFFKVGEKGYYYKVSEVQKTLKYLYSDSGNTPYSSKGIILKENGHDRKKSELFVKEYSEIYNKEIIFSPK